MVWYNQRCSVSLPVYRSPPPFLKNASRCRRSLAPCTRLPINKPHKRSSLFFSILVSDYICVGFTCFLPTLESTSPLPSKYQSLPTLTDALDQTSYKETSRDPGRSQTAMAFPPFMILVSDQIYVGLTSSSIASFFSCWCQCLLHYHVLMHRS